MRHFAARHLPYLILRAVGTLTPASNPSNALGFAIAEMTAAMGNWTSEGELGGYYWKVVRWAYQKQGLFQPPGAPLPVTSVGAPPAVDVFIDDGRHGEYQYDHSTRGCKRSGKPPISGTDWKPMGTRSIRPRSSAAPIMPMCACIIAAHRLHRRSSCAATIAVLRRAWSGRMTGSR